MEVNLIQTMKKHGEEASHALLIKVGEGSVAFDRDRFVHLVKCHVLNTGPVPHFESVLKVVDSMNKQTANQKLKF